MKMSTVASIGYVLSLLVILAAAILILREWSGPGGVEVSPLAYSLLLLGLVGLTGTAPIFMLTHLGLGKLLGITVDDEPAE